MMMRDARLSDINFLSEAEIREILVKFNAGGAVYEAPKPLHVLLEEQVSRAPEAEAVSLPTGANGAKRSLTYRQLNSGANRLAGELRRRGVGPDYIVALSAGRSIEMLIGILGILKSGGGYMPIDSGFPGARVQMMLKDSGTGLLVTESALEGEIPFSGETLLIDAPVGESADVEVVPNLENVNGADDLAYVIYTSGTTGLPKGTLVKHENVVRVVKETNYISIEKNDVLLQLSNYAFDGSVFDIYGALLNGARLVMAPSEAVVDAAALMGLIRREGVTVFFITAALFNALVDIDMEGLSGVRKIVFGGERASFPHVSRALAHLGRGRLINGYGPTETAVFAATYPVDNLEESAGVVPIGFPLPGTSLSIVDRYGRIQPVGVPGELVIGGPCVSRGYLNRPELTAEAFTLLPEKTNLSHVFDAGSSHPLPFSFPTSFYRTGDLCRWLPDGSIEYMDRLDQQVKIRGFRIEPGEIETILLSHEGVIEAVVLARDASDGTKYLCAYVVSGVRGEGDGELDGEGLREFLLSQLPLYMVPSYFIFLERLPINRVTGKVNRRELPLPEADTGLDYVAPGDETEERLAEIWRGILGRERVGVRDDFFQVGGNSLRALRLVAAIREGFDVEISVMDIFSHVTIHELAQFIRGGYGRYVESEVVLLNGENEEKVFCFPPGVGYGIVYRELATLFPERAFYGFNFIEEADGVARYIEHMKRLQPEGPYVLMGWSAGGNLAFEVAKGLEAAGLAVSRVILFDAHKLAPADKPEDFQEFYEGIDTQLERLGLSSMKEKVKRKTAAYLHYWRALPSDGQIAGSIDLLAASLEGAAKGMVDHDAWKGSTSGKFSKYDASGSHREMLVSPYLEVNADILRRILEGGGEG